jgi:Mg2+ and Co2+ transporter CorA
MQAIIRHVIESYRALATLIEADVDAMHEAIFNSGRAISVEDIYLFKREMIELRRGIGPLWAVLNQLVTEHRDLVPTDLMYYLRDVITLESESARRVNSFDNIVGDLLDNAIGRIAVQQNDEMRKISAWGALALVVTGLAGIYGMRFDHPELHWPGAMRRCRSLWQESVPSSTWASDATAGCSAQLRQAGIIEHSGSTLCRYAEYRLQSSTRAASFVAQTGFWGHV